MNKLILAPVILIVSVLIAFIFQQATLPYLANDQFKYIAFIVFYLMLPGFFVFQRFSSLDVSIEKKLIFSLPLGLFMIFVLSWLSKLLGIPWLLHILLALALLGAFEIFNWVKNKRSELFDQDSIWQSALVSIFFLICGYISFYAFSMRYPAPEEMVPIMYYQDSMWQLGNTWSYIRGIPIEDPRMTGAFLSYHMLQNIFEASAFDTLGVDPFYSHFHFNPLMFWFFIAASLVYSMASFLKANLKEILILGILIFFCVYGGYKFSGYIRHLYSNQLSLFFGFPGLLIFSFHLMGYLNKKIKLNAFVALPAFFYMVATKAILAPMFCVALAIILILHYYKKKPKEVLQKEAWLGFGMLAIGILLKLTMFSYSSGRFAARLTTAKQIRGVSPDLLNNLTEYAREVGGIGKYIIWGVIARLAVYLDHFWNHLGVLFYNPIFWLFISLIIVHRIKKKSFNLNEAELMFAIAIGFILLFNSIFTFVAGDVYCLWYSAILIPLMAFNHFRVFLNSFPKVLVVAVLGALVFFGVKSTKKLVYGAYYRGHMIEGFREAQATRPPYDTVVQEKDYLTKEEYDGLKWMRNNTDKNKVFFSTRRYTGFGKRTYARFFVFSAFSGRRAYVEGEAFFLVPEVKKRAIERWSVVNNFLEKRDLESLKRIKADYFIHSKRFDERTYDDIEQFVRVFDNKYMSIYEIKI